MTHWQGLDIESEGTGISAPLSEHINLMGGLLGHVIREQAGGHMLELVEELRLLAKNAILTQNPICVASLQIKSHP